MELEERNTNNKAYQLFKSSIDIGMGVLYIVISVYAMKMKYISEQYGKSTVWIIASLFIFYGAFRIYRGIRFYVNRK